MPKYYAAPGEGDTAKDNAFIHAVSSIVEWGCHDAPSCADGDPADRLAARRTAFAAALSALRVPTARSDLLGRHVVAHLEARRTAISTRLLKYDADGKDVPSQRYTFIDFRNAVERFSRPRDASNATYPQDVTYFNSSDHPPLYLGDPFAKDGHKYGVANLALFRECVVARCP